MQAHSPIDWLNQYKNLFDSIACLVKNRPVSLESAFEIVDALFKEINNHSSAIWWIGNGGSAAICSHLSHDVLNKLRIRSQALTDAALLTCMANDHGYPNVYAKPLEVLTKEGDLLIAISSSGRSENILRCAKYAINNKMKLITLSGFDIQNPLWNHPADVSFHIPSKLYGQVELGHEALLHAVIETAWLRNGKDTLPNDRQYK